MKDLKLNLIVLAVLLLSACNPYYYQVYQAIPTTDLTIEQNVLVYEDENCEVVYNLWAEGGNIGFSFYNKTDQDIYLNKDKSFFILNGLAQDYYKDRVFSSGASSGSSIAKGASKSTSAAGLNIFNLFQTNREQESKKLELLRSYESSVAYNEQKIVCIPSKSLKYFEEYKIAETLYRDCDLLRYPNKKQAQTKKFYVNDSPIVFSNRIAYSVGDSKELINFENEFYIAQISNYHEKDVTVKKFVEFCGERSNERIRYFENTSPDKFYIKYEKKDDVFNH